MNTLELSAAQLRRAADIKDEIETLRGEFVSLLGNGTPKQIVARRGRPPKKRWSMPESAKIRLRAVMKARWRKARAAGQKAL
jgi:hypothetical protein